jgi:hypothetical protein
MDVATALTPVTAGMLETAGLLVTAVLQATAGARMPEITGIPANSMHG